MLKSRDQYDVKDNIGVNCHNDCTSLLIMNPGVYVFERVWYVSLHVGNLPRVSSLLHYDCSIIKIVSYSLYSYIYVQCFNVHAIFYRNQVSFVSNLERNFQTCPLCEPKIISLGLLVSPAACMHCVL